jgi:hypothetical protein
MPVGQPTPVKFRATGRSVDRDAPKPSVVGLSEKRMLAKIDSDERHFFHDGSPR